MIAEIGIIIGLYIITRMLSLLLKKEKRAENIAVKILAVLTIIITVIVTANFLLRGMQNKNLSLFQQEHETSQISPQDKLKLAVERLAEKIRLAHLNKDIDKWQECYAPDYPNRSQLKNSILELWESHDVKEVSYRISHVQRLGNNQASALIVWFFQVYDLRSHDVQVLRQSYRVTLEKTHGDWKIKNSMEEVEPKS
jgi:hypothetical protein